MMGNCWLGSAVGNCASHRHDNPSPSEPLSSSLLSPFTSPRSSSLLCLSSPSVVPSSLPFVLLRSPAPLPTCDRTPMAEKYRVFLQQVANHATLRDILEMVQTVWQCRYIIFHLYLPAKRFCILSIKRHIFLVAISKCRCLSLRCFPPTLTVPWEDLYLTPSRNPCPLLLSTPAHHPAGRGRV